MSIECPFCHIEFNDADIQHTVKDGLYQCPVCNKKFPSSLTENEPEKKISHNWLIFCLSAIILVLGTWIVFHGGDTGKTSQESAPRHHVTPNVPQVSDIPAAAPLPAQSVVTPTEQATAPAASVSAPTPVSLPLPIQDKLQIVEKIAMDFHKNHTYTLEGDFVCLDMAITVWNQVVTNGIAAKIMVGNVQEDITWSYRALITRTNHAWVLARVSPNEEVAVETTAGGVIRKNMKNSSLYFKGIEFDNPAQVKEFDILRKQLVVCRDANEMVADWNDNVAGRKQRVTPGIIEKKAITEERIKACEAVVGALGKFKSRAVYY
jgi:hypothetical protein